MLPNPKRSVNGRPRELYEYYAGYSAEFVRAALESSGMHERAIVADPWNGAGTTTRVAAEKGCRPRGYDLNPAMVIVAKASLLADSVRPSTLPLGRDILRKSIKLRVAGPLDPLQRWFKPSAAGRVRGIELAIQDILVQESYRGRVASLSSLDGISSLAAFYYTALFRVVRKLTNCFRTSNPTWIIPTSNALETSAAELAQLFAHEIECMEEVLGISASMQCDDAHLGLADSRQLPLADGSVDVVLSSPPYCTRIDYAIATLPELAVLNASDETILGLRQTLIGSPVLSRSIAEPTPRWGQTCTVFLSSVQEHPSKGSKGYYLKVFMSYFHRLFASLEEIRRVTRSGGHVFLVVQDSYYKEVHNNLPSIVHEMASNLNFDLVKRRDFIMPNSMRNINTRSRAYRRTTATTESVLHFHA